ncbi:hypothetical protein CBF23_003030 [Marinomonas agarivorans]|nr:hypothetical protein CBF23_003030 [Marinomonas agarivorans]
MSRLHQINCCNYSESCTRDILLSLQTGDAILLIEEGVLRAQRQDPVLTKAHELHIPVYLLAEDAAVFGITQNTNGFTAIEQLDEGSNKDKSKAQPYQLINAAQWVTITEKYDHIAW